MNLLFLCKRRPMGKDLFTSPYGRFFYLPKLLAESGHDVVILLLDYENTSAIDAQQYGFRWISAPVFSYTKALQKQMNHTRPDWIIGFSDTYFGILASHYGRKLGYRSCIDAYDNYESYLPWLKPLHWAWRRALAQADLITAAGPALIELMSANRQGQSTAVVPMAADPIGFRLLDKIECRKLLELPTDVTQVGYCGSLHRSRGVEVFFDAIRMMQERRPDIRFIHSGRTWNNVPLPSSLQSLGYIDDDIMPSMLNCMDTLVVINRPSAFGHYSHPVKLYEAMSCQVPVVATRTLAAEWILRDHANCLFEPDNPEALCAAIIKSLRSPHPHYRSMPTWQSSCAVFERALLAGQE